jgi:adenosylmethionine-8-amino-7-oxononanoate aminotransferase
MVGDIRGDGAFYSAELVKDKATKATFTPAERDVLIKQFMVPRARELGVYMRVDDRAETAAQFSPPLVAGRAELDEFMGVFRQVLDEAWERFVESPAA